jgi:hypothetical protein
MIVTPEFVKVEMEYRLERALAGDELEHVRAARRLQRPWWRRVFSDRTDQPSTSSNQVRFAS